MKNEFKILKLFSKRRSLNLSNAAAILNVSTDSLSEIFSYLMKNNFIVKESPFFSDLPEDQFDLHTSFRITFLGEKALRDDHKDKFRFWFPIIISIAALIISIIALSK